MTDDTETEIRTESAQNGDDGDEPDRRSHGRDSSVDDAARSMVTYLRWSLFAILLLVVLVATFRFYFAASAAVDRFVTGPYRSLFQAAFNLGVVLVGGIGLSMLVRRMR